MLIAAIALVGLFAGVMGGLLGVGGGIVIVPLLILFLKMDPRLAIGTSLGAIVPGAIMAAYRHHALGNVNWRVVGMLTLGSIAGAFIGASLTAHVSSDRLRQIFAVFLIVTAVRMLWK